LQKNKIPESHNILFLRYNLGNSPIIALFLFSFFTVCSQTRFEYGHQQMGTQIRLIFYTSNKRKADSVANLAFNRIDNLNNKLSDYKQNSELNKLCRQTNEDVVVSNDLYRILNESVRISEDTNGAFDVTAGPLIQLWRKTRKTSTLPTTSDLVEAKQNVGHKHIKFPKKNVVLLNANAMQLDLGGIGKGFTADEVIKVLGLNDITSALVDLGGDIRVSNPPPGKEHWVLAFSYYNEEGKEVIKKIGLKDAAVATSGDMYQYVEIDGKKYSHIINPKTGMALNNNIQVTTIAKNATLADAYASALSVMGITKAKLFLKNNTDLNVFMVEQNEGRNKSWQSLNFKNLRLK